MVIKPFKHSHPTVLFIYFLMVIVLSIVQQNYYLMILSFMGAVMVDYCFNPLTFFKDLKYSIILILIVTITNPLFVSQGANILYQNNFITITSQALGYGFVFGIMLGGMLMWFKVLKTCLSDSQIIYLFGTVLPVLGLVISMSLNIISKLKRQYQKIKEANLNIKTKNKFIYYRNVFVVLVTYAFESSLDMMNSMTARGYGQGKRTSFHLYSFRKDDGLKLIVILGLAFISWWGYFTRYHSFYYYPIIQEYMLTWQDVFFMTAYLGLMLAPLYLGGKKDV